jgi:hypothetical protein
MYFAQALRPLCKNQKGPSAVGSNGFTENFAKIGKNVLPAGGRTSGKKQNL